MDGLRGHLLQKGQNHMFLLIGALDTLNDEEYDSDALMEDAAMDGNRNASNIAIMFNQINTSIFNLMIEYIQDVKCM